MGFFKKIIDGLKKTKQNIGFKISQLFKRGVFDDAFFIELEDILLSADVGTEATEQIVEDLKERINENKTSDVQMAQKLLRDVMSDILGDEKFNYQTPAVILVTGVNGVGKTTTIGKLAKIFHNKGKSVTVAAADTFRAAASDQLEIWADRANVRIVKHGEGSDAAAVVYDAIASVKSKKTDVLIVDTAGRLHNKKNLMEELKKINRIIDQNFPNAVRSNILVMDATTGQNGIVQAEVFNEAVDIDGIVLTKLDGTAKGGVVFAISAKMEIPVWFIGVGEQIDDLMEFDAESFIEGIL